MPVAQFTPHQNGDAKMDRKAKLIENDYDEFIIKVPRSVVKAMEWKDGDSLFIDIRNNPNSGRNETLLLEKAG